MKGICVSLLITNIAWTADVALPNTVQRLENGEETRIVCFGDSITGVYYHTGNRMAYADFVEQGLRRLFPKTPVHVLNAGVSGDTTEKGLARMDRHVLGCKPHLVVVMFGLNDASGLPGRWRQTSGLGGDDGVVERTKTSQVRAQGGNACFISLWRRP